MEILDRISDTFKAVIHEGRIYFGQTSCTVFRSQVSCFFEQEVGDIVVATPLVLSDGILFTCMDGVIRR